MARTEASRNALKRPYRRDRGPPWHRCFGGSFFGGKPPLLSPTHGREAGSFRSLSCRSRRSLRFGQCITEPAVSVQGRRFALHLDGQRPDGLMDGRARPPTSPRRLGLQGRFGAAPPLPFRQLHPSVFSRFLEANG